MKQQILMTSISIDELEDRIVNRLKAELNTHQSDKQVPAQDDYITVKEAAKLLKTSTTTIHTWKSNGQLRFYRFGSRVRFKRSEVMQHEKPNKAK